MGRGWVTGGGDVGCRRVVKGGWEGRRGRGGVGCGRVVKGAWVGRRGVGIWGVEGS